ncbi:MAG: hypothetical protein JNM79_09205 [Burkholderiales bacterium]|nr:hypothetical protein [Burkholderiales bacterium]
MPPQFREIIRRILPASAALVLSACTSVTTPGGGTTVVALPGVAHVMDRDVYNRAGTQYTNPRWFADPDSHPAVRPAAGRDHALESGQVSTVSAAEQRADGQVAGAVIGTLIGAQAGNRLGGVAVGSAVGATLGGKAADPCGPGLNQGSFWGGLAGAWFGSFFGGGRGREFWTALGAAGGALRGAEIAADGRRCR